MLLVKHVAAYFIMLKLQCCRVRRGKRQTIMLWSVKKNITIHYGNYCSGRKLSYAMHCWLQKWIHRFSNVIKNSRFLTIAVSIIYREFSGAYYTATFVSTTVNFQCCLWPQHFQSITVNFQWRLKNGKFFMCGERMVQKL